MLDIFHLPTKSVANVQEFTGNSVVAGVTWSVWRKPRGVTQCYIFLVGQGGGGGSGIIGAASTAAGGGGGGSGGQTVVDIPTIMLPDILYISTGMAASGAGQASYVSIRPDTTANHVIAIANGGGAGGNAAGATAGAAGAAGAIATVATMPIGWQFATVLAGQAGIIGGTTVAGAALTLPVTGLLVTGGTGGGGQPAAAAAGTAGGAFTVPAAPSPFPAQIGGIGGTAATVPPTTGSNGINGGMMMGGLWYSYGGTGGGSTHGSTTGAGLFQASGGSGGYGSGGGGMGGALTSSVAGVLSRGGSGYCRIICW